MCKSDLSSHLAERREAVDEFVDETIKRLFPKVKRRESTTDFEVLRPTEFNLTLYFVTLWISHQSLVYSAVFPTCAWPR